MYLHAYNFPHLHPFLTTTLYITIYHLHKNILERTVLFLLNLICVSTSQIRIKKVKSDNYIILLSQCDSLKFKAQLLIYAVALMLFNS